MCTKSLAKFISCSSNLTGYFCSLMMSFTSAISTLSCLRGANILQKLLQWITWGKYSVFVPKLISALRNYILGTLRKVYILHCLYRNCILILLLQIPDSTVHCNLKDCLNGFWQKVCNCENVKSIYTLGKHNIVENHIHVAT